VRDTETSHGDGRALHRKLARRRDPSFTRRTHPQRTNKPCLKSFQKSASESELDMASEHLYVADVPEAEMDV
jgi:hypothetical protein